LLTTTAAVALLAALPARAQDATWSTAPGSSNFNTAANWTPATVPTGTAFFGASTTTSLSFSANTTVGGFTFNAGAPAYTFTVPSPAFSLTFSGAGIGGGDVTITNNGLMRFLFFSTAGNANITNNSFLQFVNETSAGNATITTATGAATLFSDTSTAGLARLITNAGGAVDFSSNRAPNVTAGSIEGAGVYFLSPNALTVGGNNLSTTVSGVITGPGSLIKAGTGTLTLAGTNSYSGATVVAGGTLAVTGDISSSSGVLVGPTAMLSGTGTVPGVLVAPGATLMPGQSVGTLNVAGNLVFASAATYLININAIAASQANVSGVAALNGATVQVVDDSNITKRRVYTLLTASGGIIGTFNPDIVGVKNKVELFYDANNVYLCDHCKFSDLLAFGQLPFFASQILGAIDAAIDANVTLPGRFANLLALALQPQARALLVNALIQLTGEVHTGAEQASFQSTNSFLRLMLDPFAETRGTAGFGSAMGFAPERSAAFPPEVALAYASVLKEPAAQPAVASRPWNVWASGYGGRATIGGDLRSAAMMPACATTVMPAVSITASRPIPQWALRWGAPGPTGPSRTRSAPDAATRSRAGSMAPRAGAPPTCRRRWLMRRIGCRRIAS